MISEDDIIFCIRREAEERAAAAATADPMIRDIHLAMADRYADRAWGLEEARHLETILRQSG